MRSRGALMLLIAAIAGLAAVFLAARWMQNQGGERGRIAVANVDIELGGKISPEMIRLAAWPEGSVPAGAFHEATKLDGRVVLVSIQRGEPLTEARLAPIGTKGGLSAVVPLGKRAMTVRVIANAVGSRPRSFTKARSTFITSIGRSRKVASDE